MANRFPHAMEQPYTILLHQTRVKLKEDQNSNSHPHPSTLTSQPTFFTSSNLKTLLQYKSQSMKLLIQLHCK
jgi:hypothetical protein